MQRQTPVNRDNRTGSTSEISRVGVRSGPRDRPLQWHRRAGCFIGLIQSPLLVVASILSGLAPTVLWSDSRSVTDGSRRPARGHEASAVPIWKNGNRRTRPNRPALRPDQRRRWNHRSVAQVRSGHRRHGFHGEQPLAPRRNCEEKSFGGRDPRVVRREIRVSSAATGRNR